MKKTTMQDVAELAGVSKSTVSQYVRDGLYNFNPWWCAPKVPRIYSVAYIELKLSLHIIEEKPSLI